METAKQIHDRMINNIGEEYDTNNGSFIYDATRPAAIVFSDVQKEIETVKSKLDIENLSSEELERFVYQRTALSRKKATKATTSVIISGSVGSSVKVGDLVATDSINYLITEDKVIGEEGFMTVIVECESFGTVGNVPSNSITKFPVTLSGLVDVYNPSEVTNGYNAETDDELKERYYEKLQRPGKAGNVYHYLEWAKSVVGVGGAKVTPRWNGALTVKVTIIDSNKTPADEELIKKVTSYIGGEMPFGADLTVEGATGVPINVQVTINLVDEYIQENVVNTIKTNITNYLKDIAFNTNFVSYAKIGSIIIDSEGVLDYQNLLVNSGTSNIQINENEVAILGGVTV